jgi:hypothetical protein
MSSLPKLRTADSVELSALGAGLLQAINERLKARQQARPMGFKKRPSED